MNENLIICMNNNNKSDSKQCEITINFDKPLHLRRKMEVALVKLSLPNDLYTSSLEDEMIFTLNIEFLRVADKYLEEDYSDGNSFVENYSFNLKRMGITYPLSVSDKKKIFDKIQDITKKMNIKFKKIWNKIHKLRTVNVEENDEMVDDIQFTFEKDDVQPSIEFYALLTYRKLEIIVNSNNNDVLVMKQGEFIIKILDKHNIVFTSHFKAVGYVTMNEALHQLLSQTTDNYPISTFHPNGFATVPRSEDALLMLEQQFITKKSINPLSFDNYNPNIIPTVVYVYSDIVTESYVDEQKVNLLQIYVQNNVSSNRMDTVEFKNLIYFPLRIDELSSITLQLRDVYGKLLNYDKGNINAILKLRPIEHI